MTYTRYINTPLDGSPMAQPRINYLAKCIEYILGI